MGAYHHPAADSVNVTCFLDLLLYGKTGMVMRVALLLIVVVIVIVLIIAVASTCSASTSSGHTSPAVAGPKNLSTRDTTQPERNDSAALREDLIALEVAAVELPRVAGSAGGGRRNAACRPGSSGS
jgi:hypothetical protein